MKHRRYAGIIVSLFVLLVLTWVAPAFADVTWFFNWYCSDCGVYSRSTGTEGPFGTRSACESARAAIHAIQTTMHRRGRGVRAEDCYSVGFDIDRESPSNSESPSSAEREYRRRREAPPPPLRPYNDNPDGEDAIERSRAARERREAEQRRREDDERQEFEREKAALLGDLKGVATTGLKTSSAAISVSPDPTWQRISCAGDLAGSAANAILEFELSGNQTAFYEAQFLLDQTQVVLGGGTAKVECRRALPLLSARRTLSAGLESPLGEFYRYVTHSNADALAHLLAVRKDDPNLALSKKQVQNTLLRNRQALSAVQADPSRAATVLRQLQVAGGRLAAPSVAQKEK